MTEELGLAENAVKQRTSDPVMDVVMLLRQGATPEELVQGGVPAALVEQAMMIIQAEQKKAQQPQEEEAGLAAMLGGGVVPNRSTII